ncbi:conjugal transfer protein TraD, partial [Vibrio xuii]
IGAFMHTPTRKKSNHFTRGGQVTFHAITMFFQVNNKLVKFIGWGVVALTLLLTYLNSPPNAFWGEFYYLRNVMYAKLGKPLDSTVTTIWEGQRYTDTLTSQLQNPVLLDIHATIWHNLQIYFLISLVIGMAIFMIALRFFK